jgi:hypothetical protein
MKIIKIAPTFLAAVFACLTLPAQDTAQRVAVWKIAFDVSTVTVTGN